MASNTGAHPEQISQTRSTAQDIPQQQTRPQEDLPAPTPVEMSSLPSHSTAAQPDNTSLQPAPSNTPAADIAPSGPMRTDTTTAINQSTNPAPPPAASIAPTHATRIFSTAIGPSSDQPLVPSKDTESSGPTLMITLLLTSGARHPFKLDSKYLAKRNVEVPSNDPFNLSVYKLKELILREWREEWEAKPSSPSYIRLISFGKLLDDKAPLKDSRFNEETPNVLHMTIKPQDYVEDEDAKAGKAAYSGSRDGEGRSPGCRCVIM